MAKNKAKHSTEFTDFQQVHRQWVEEALAAGRTLRDERWPEAIAVGSLGFLETVKGELGSRALHRKVEHIEEAYALRGSSEAYDGNLVSKTGPVRPENTILWNQNPEATHT